MLDGMREGLLLRFLPCFCPYSAVKFGGARVHAAVFCRYDGAYGARKFKDLKYCKN
jgi:hypothetical protein